MSVPEFLAVWSPNYIPLGVERFGNVRYLTGRSRTAPEAIRDHHYLSIYQSSKIATFVWNFLEEVDIFSV
jgi:hypothetical protein